MGRAGLSTVGEKVSQSRPLGLTVLPRRAVSVTSRDTLARECQEPHTTTPRPQWGQSRRLSAGASVLCR